MEKETAYEKYILPVRKRSTLKFILFHIITLGIYPYFWLWKIIKDINNLEIIGFKKLNYWAFAIWFILLDIYDLFNTIITWDSDVIFTTWDKLYIQLTAIVLLFVSISVLRRIEAYTQQKYNIKIKHNILGILFLTALYTNYALNSYSERVSKQSNKVNLVQ